MRITLEFAISVWKVLLRFFGTVKFEVEAQREYFFGLKTLKGYSHKKWFQVWLNLVESKFGLNQCIFRNNRKEFGWISRTNIIYHENQITE